MQTHAIEISVSNLFTYFIEMVMNMIYNDYQAFVYCNNSCKPERQLNKENVFAFNKSYAIDPNQDTESKALLEKLLTALHHGVLGNGHIRVICREEHPPYLLECTNHRVRIIPYDIKYNHYVGGWEFEVHYKGYVFYGYNPLNRNELYHVTMAEPRGRIWHCNYGKKIRRNRKEDVNTV